MKRTMLFIPAICLLILSCDLLSSSGSDTTIHKMYVYSNTAQKFYLIDYQTFELVKDIPLQMPFEVNEEISGLRFMTLSTDRNYLFFEAAGTWPDPSLGFAVYDIEREEFSSLFYTDFIRSGPTRFIAAQDQFRPGLIYAHLRDYGTYAIDVFEQKIKETISEEHQFRLAKHFQAFPDFHWIIVHYRFSGTGGFHKLQFYNTDSGLQTPEFILNEAGKDSIAIYDFEFAKDGERLFVTYQLSDGCSRDIESYFGSYDLQTGELYESELRFPWSLNPYYTAYSPKRNEVYTIGAYQELHIIDSENYEKKNVIKITEKIDGPALLKLNPDEQFLFVSAANSDAIFVIDLDDKQVINKVGLERPYYMIIP